MRCTYVSMCAFFAAIFVGVVCFAAEPQSPKDFTNVAVKDLGIEPVRATKDTKTGFIVGGKNATVLSKGLTEIDGRAIAALEADMRPGAMSDAGFLGKDEKFLEVLAADNAYVVDKLGLTHQQLALHLRVLAQIGERERLSRSKFGPEIRYHGRKFQIKIVAWRGYQESPFRDNTRTDREATVKNLDNGKSLHYSLLVPKMIERYGFYEGHGTKFRVDPKQVVEVLDFLQNGDKR